MSKLEVNAVEPQCGTNLTLGASGDTIIIPSGATISNQGTAAGFGPTGAVSWNTTKITADPNPAVTGVGYFADTTSAAFTITLPSSPSAGAVIGIADYANTFATNNVTVDRNGSNIAGAATNGVLSTNGVSVTFVYVDATQGWIVTDSGNRSDLPLPQYVTATGGTITTSGDYKIHTFTGPGTFTVCSVGNPSGSDSVDYLVVAGGGGGGTDQGGGAGAGGYRESSGAASGCYSRSPLGACVSALPVTAQGYPIIVGSGGTGATLSPALATQGNNSSALGITSTGGGIGGTYPTSPSANLNGGPGGSGGGGGGNCSVSPGGTGNTPPVSPPQGTNGATTPAGPAYYGGNGGGATGAGTSNCTGGTGATSSITGSSVNRAGGGGGRSTPSPAGVPYGGGVFSAPTSPSSNGTVNTGGGGGAGGAGSPGCSGGAGGSGIVIIRYKFQ
jgi:hypothetical protein